MPDARWNDPREYNDRDHGDGRPRVYGERDRGSGWPPGSALSHDVSPPLVAPRPRTGFNRFDGSNRLDEAFLFAQSIDATSYERQRDRLREELTLAQIGHHAEAVDELDGVVGLQAAAAAAVLPGRDRVRRNSIQSNRRNGATFQLLGAESEC